ncbi:MAG: tetratricopeptide repeat protein [Nitrospiraceae bacterium]|nr:MAG: tetratricopeptide repeat protein [Nitrospiraceae bacterium]
MGKLAFFIIIIFFAAIAFFSIENAEITTIKIPFDGTYNVPKITLILISSAVGFFLTLLFVSFRDTRRFIDNWQVQRKQKQEVKIQELYSKALNSLLSHDRENAKGALEGILKENPEYINALLRLGDIYAEENNFQQANGYYQQARGIDPKNFETLFLLEQLMEKTDRWSEAVRYLDDILETDGKNLTALYRKRSIYEKQGRWDDILALQKTILKHEHSQKEKERGIRDLLGYEYEYGRDSLENNQLEKAKKAFKSILRTDQYFTPATLGITEVLVREGENEEAINLLEKMYEQTGSKVVLARLEDLLINLNEPARLIRIYKNGISRNPNDPVTKFFLGKLYYRLEMIDDAFEILTSMDAGGAAYQEQHQLLGNLYVRRNELEKAIEEFKKVIDFKSAVRLPYCCNNCGTISLEWSGRCHECRQWNTYEFNLDGH